MFNWCRSPEAEEPRSAPTCSRLSEKQAFRDESNAQETHLPAYSSCRFGQDETTATITDKIDSLSKELRVLSLDMHDHPEIAWEEKRTHDILVKFMKQHGFKVTPHAYGIETAWEATYQHKEGGRTIGFNSEEDALPKVGHACGHNLIAIGGIAAALGCAEALKKHDLPGKVVLLGTPAEERGGGKIKLIEKGAYKQMDLCLMIHPTPLSGLIPMLAVSEVVVEFFGHGAHAAMAPHEGINALDAAVTTYNAISVMRQQLLPSDRAHAVIYIPENAPVNIIPDYCKMKCAVRSFEYKRLVDLQKRLENCIQAGTISSGCKVKMEWDYTYKDLRNNSALGQEYIDYMKTLGVEVPITTEALGSTDFGNVSYELPALHPMFAIPTGGEGNGNHTPGFTEAARTKAAHEEAIKSAKGMAVAAFRSFIDEGYYKTVREVYEQDKKDRSK